MNIDSINNEKDKIFNDYMNEVLVITGDLFKKPLTKVSYGTLSGPNAFQLLNCIFSFQFSPIVLYKAYRLRKIIGYLRSVGKQKIVERLRDDAARNDQNDILAGILKSSSEFKRIFVFFLSIDPLTPNDLISQQ